MLTEKIMQYDVKHIRKDLVMQFGDFSDGAIEFAGIVDKGLAEVAYFYGDDKPKNIVVVSQQVGCSSRCSFCELGDQPFIRNLTSDEVFEQVVLMLQQAHQYGMNLESKPHKVNYSKSGEPLLNPYFVDGLKKVGEFGFSYKVSTVFPYGKAPLERFYDIAEFASKYNAPVQIQISLLSTNSSYRENLARIKLASMHNIREAAYYWRERDPFKRKINLSLVLTKDNPVSIGDVKDILPTELFQFRLREYMPTENGESNSLKTTVAGELDRIVTEFKDAGYDISTSGVPTPIEKRFGLASNVTLRRYKRMLRGEL
jgi:hypothetical protein